MRDGSSARAVCSKAFLFRPEDFSTLHVVDGQHEYACGSEFVERVGQGDWTEVVQCGGVLLFLEEDGVAVEPREGCDSCNAHGLEEEFEGLVKS